MNSHEAPPGSIQQQNTPNGKNKTCSLFSIIYLCKVHMFGGQAFMSSSRFIGNSVNMTIIWLYLTLPSRRGWYVMTVLVACTKLALCPSTLEEIQNWSIERTLARGFATLLAVKTYFSLSFLLIMQSRIKWYWIWYTLKLSNWSLK
jgi:hypothetical protein